MFGIPGKQAVTLTPAATKQIVKLMEREGALASKKAAVRAWNTPWNMLMRSTPWMKPSNRTVRA